MNLNTEKIKFLLELFTELNDEFQNIAIARVSELLYDQKAKAETRGATEDNVNEFIMNEKVSKKAMEMKHDAVEFYNTVTQLNHEQQAQMILTMERLQPGSFTKKEEISISIISKELSLKEYFSIHFPDIDYEKVRKNEEILFNKIKNNK